MNPPSGHDIVVIGASRGGTEPLETIVGDLPAHLPATVLVVRHFAATSSSYLESILDRAGALPICFAQDGTSIAPGCIYVGPPDRHLLVMDGRLRLTRGPRENRFRPAIDPLFRSAAVAYGPRVVAVLLSGLLSDGTAGLAAVKRCGGVAVIQDPEDASSPDMPLNALASMEVDHCLPAAEIGGLIARLAIEPVPEASTRPPTS